MAGRAAIQQLESFHPTTLIRLLEACARVGHSDPVFLAAASGHLAEQAAAGGMTPDQTAMAMSSVCEGLSKLLRRERLEVAPPGHVNPNKLEQDHVMAEERTSRALCQLSESLSPILLRLSPSQLAVVASAVARFSSSLSSSCRTSGTAGTSSSITSGRGRLTVVSPEFVSGIWTAARHRAEDLRSLPRYGALLWAASELGCMDASLRHFAAQAVVAKLSPDQRQNVPPKWLALVLLVLARRPSLGSPDGPLSQSPTGVPGGAPLSASPFPQASSSPPPSVDSAMGLLAQLLVSRVQELENDTLVSLLEGLLVRSDNGSVRTSQGSSSLQILQLANVLLQEIFYRMEQGTLQRLQLIVHIADALRLLGSSDTIARGGDDQGLMLQQKLRHQVESCIRDALHPLPAAQQPPGKATETTPPPTKEGGTAVTLLTPGLSIRAAQALVHLGGPSMDVSAIRRALVSAAYGIRAVHGAPGEAVLPEADRRMVLEAREIMGQARMSISDAKLLSTFNRWLTSGGPHVRKPC